MKAFLSVCFLLVILSPRAALGQSPQEPPPASIAPAESPSPSAAKPATALPPEKANPVKLARFETAPVIDGRLDEEVWKTAAKLKDFYQTQPGDNIAPSKPTEVYLGFDSKTLYIAFHAYDEPDKVRATVAERDNVFEDDNVRILLDTFNDRRKAYILMFNPLGIQTDGILTEGNGEDYSLDIVMESKGSLTEDGYIVEVAIPFKSLRYEAGKDKLWRIHAYRRIKRFDNELNSWMPNSRSRSDLLGQAGQLSGLEGISTERSLEIIPTLTISEEGRRVRALSFSDVAGNPALRDPGRFTNKPARLDPGLTMKLGITSNITLDFTANPDFAQVEADQPVVTANQRFPIFFAEKRPFFLEGIDIFQTQLRAVHTRAIIDPDYAVKLTGKQGRNTFGLLLASDNAPGDFSDEEKADPDLFDTVAKFADKNAYIGVLRVKRDIGKESSLGLLATSYNFIEKHNQLGGIDGRFRLDPKTVLTFQVLGTTSNRFFFDPERGEDVYRKGNALGYAWNYDYTDRNFGYFIEGGGRTRDYRADVGFTQRTNNNYTNAFFRFSTDPKPKAFLISTRAINITSTSYDFQGRMQGMENFSNVNFGLVKQSFFEFGVAKTYERLFEEEFGPKRTLTRAGTFAGDSERSSGGYTVSMAAGTNPSKKYSGSIFIGRRFNAFDFDFGAGPKYPRVSPSALLDPEAPLDPGTGTAKDLQLSFLYQPTDALSASIVYTKAKLIRNDTGRTAFDDDIYTLKATYQFTRFTFARARVDYDSLSSSVRGQYLLGWTPNPGTSLYVGYNDDLSIHGYSPFTGHKEPGWKRNGRTFFIKTSYLFRRSL